MIESKRAVKRLAVGGALAVLGGPTTPSPRTRPCKPATPQRRRRQTPRELMAKASRKRNRKR